MKQESAASIKKRLRHGTVSKLRHEPLPGSRMREIFDLFWNSKGRPVLFSAPSSTRKGRNDARRIINLREIYGMDIRSIRHGVWILAGEWCGRGYIDYVADAAQQDDDAEVAERLADLLKRYQDDDDAKNL